MRFGVTAGQDWAKKDRVPFKSVWPNSAVEQERTREGYQRVLGLGGPDEATSFCVA